MLENFGDLKTSRPGWEVGEVGKGDQKVETSSYKINKF